MPKKRGPQNGPLSLLQAPARRAGAIYFRITLQAALAAVLILRTISHRIFDMLFLSGENCPQTDSYARKAQQNAEVSRLSLTHATEAGSSSSRQ